MHDFRKLEVYDRALRQASAVRAMSKKFPRDELFVLTSQFRRAADSIVLNIAEGAGCSSVAEFRRFLGYSVRSGYECFGCADIAHNEKFISSTEYHQFCVNTNEIISMLVGLKKNVQ